jgi:hypothetical protein
MVKKEQKLKEQSKILNFINEDNSAIKDIDMEQETGDLNDWVSNVLNCCYYGN